MLLFSLKFKLKKLENLSNLWTYIESTVEKLESQMEKPSEQVFSTIDEDVEAFFDNNNELVFKSDAHELNAHIENLETYLNLFQSDLYDLTKEGGQRNKHAFLVKDSFFESNTQLLAFYESAMQKLDKFKEISNIQNSRMIRGCLKTTTSAHKATNINLDLNEPLVMLNSYEFNKTSTPRMTYQEAQLTDKFEIIDPKEAKNLKFKEEHKHVATVRDSDFEIKILSEDKSTDTVEEKEIFEKSETEIEPRLEEISGEEIKTEIPVESVTHDQNEIHENEIVNRRKSVRKPRNVTSGQRSQQRAVTIDRVFSVTKLLCYGLFFAILFLLVALICLPLVMTGCCDYRREFLIFNEKTFSDEPLPF
jgi:hypothetical protein